MPSHKRKSRKPSVKIVRRSAVADTHQHLVAAPFSDAEELRIPPYSDSEELRIEHGLRKLSRARTLLTIALRPCRSQGRPPRG
jgi:hypothetical protein